jgi:hypothetical protein
MSAQRRWVHRSTSSSRRLHNMIRSGVLFLPLLLAALPLLAETTEYYEAQNGENKNMTGWSKEVTLSKGKKPTSFKVLRWDGSKWVDETDHWKGTIAPVKGHDGTFGIKIKENSDNPPAPVVKGTRLRICVTYDTSAGDVGSVHGDDREYEKPKDGKHGLKRSRNDAGDSFLAEIDSAVYFGGSTGVSVPGLGLTVPADTYAYLYQVNSLSAPAITSLHISTTGDMTGLTVLRGPHDGTREFGFITTDPNAPPGSGAKDLGVAVLDTLGAGGQQPASWTTSSRLAEATFNSLSGNASSVILVGFSKDAPVIPDCVNASLSAASGDGFFVVWAPQGPCLVPALSWWGSLLLLTIVIGAGCWAITKRRRVRASV